jgi:O-methyltransferase
VANFKKTLRQFVPPIIYSLIDQARPKNRARHNLKDKHLYQPMFSPWFGLEPFTTLYKSITPYTLVSPDRAWILYTLSQQAMKLSGSVLEAGVYRGGTAMLLKNVIEQSGTNKTLRLFDTFAGMPETHAAKDYHQAGDFADTSLQGVMARVGDAPHIKYHQGFLPATFAGLEDERFSFVHIDLDIYQSVLDAVEFAYPRMTPGGFIVFDDYGFASCPGAREAVDSYFADKPERPLVLPTGQAVICKLP